jgi:hypothetical protein
MSKILTHPFKFAALLSLAWMFFAGVNCFSQCAVKTTVKNNVKTATAAEYYTYNRTGEAYDALSLKASIVTVQGAKPAFKLNLIFTSTTIAALQQLTLISDSLQISTVLVNDGAKFVDNKKFNSNTYHADLTDSVKLFITQHAIKKVILTDSQGQAITKLDIADPLFLMQQIICLQTPVKRKPIAKKPHKIGS